MAGGRPRPAAARNAADALATGSPDAASRWPSPRPTRPGRRARGRGGAPTARRHRHDLGAPGRICTSSGPRPTRSRSAPRGAHREAPGRTGRPAGPLTATLDRAPRPPATRRGGLACRARCGRARRVNTRRRSGQLPARPCSIGPSGIPYSLRSHPPAPGGSAWPSPPVAEPSPPSAPLSPAASPCPARAGRRPGTAAPARYPLRHAHAHNDYEHPRPLLDALDHGFTSVEADVFLVDGQLLVAHDPADLDPARTLESLYLDPLARPGHGQPRLRLPGLPPAAPAPDRHQDRGRGDVPRTRPPAAPLPATVHHATPTAACTAAPVTAVDLR